MQDEVQIQLSDCKDFINTHFVSKLLNFLRGQVRIVANNQE